MNTDDSKISSVWNVTASQMAFVPMLILSVSLFVVSTQLSSAQGGLPADQRINGKRVWAAFEAHREILQRSSAVIYTDERARVKSLYGTVVSEDGHILTKASEIEGKSHLSVRIGGDLYSEVDLLGVDDEWDIALLKVSSEQPLTPIVLSSDDDVRQGHWVVSNGSTTRIQRRVRLGIVSAETRKISATKSHVVLGVEFEKDKESQWKVANVSEDKGAQKAGIQVGDVIISADGTELDEREDLIELLKKKRPGDKVAIELKRDEKKHRLDVELSAREEKMTRNEQMSGGEDQLSSRRSEFPRVIDHDTPLTKVSVGGPLLNLDGVCIGMNIARASRVSTFAIPARELREIIAKMIE